MEPQTKDLPRSFFLDLVHARLCPNSYWINLPGCRGEIGYPIFTTRMILHFMSSKHHLFYLLLLIVYGTGRLTRPWHHRETLTTLCSSSLVSIMALNLHLCPCTTDATLPQTLRESDELFLSFPQMTRSSRCTCFQIDDCTIIHFLFFLLFLFSKSLKIFKKLTWTRPLSVCLSLCVSLASDSLETIEVIIIKLGMVTASDMVMHHI